MKGCGNSQNTNEYLDGIVQSMIAEVGHTSTTVSPQHFSQTASNIMKPSRQSYCQDVPKTDGRGSTDFILQV
jgi:hypothetical protein